MRTHRICAGMVRLALVLGAWLGGALVVALPAHAAEVPEAAPGADAPEGMLAWKAKDGLAYYYRMPIERDTQVPACLTILLHGSNLTRGWGLANHSWKTFRPYDIVVSPDGTTPNGNGGFNFLGGAKDVKRLKALIKELREAVPVEQVFLYGHSQGSFFALYYAGLQPKDIDGVVAHASGAWSNTKCHGRAHHQAIVLMHGTQDPVVPYDQSVSALPTYVQAKYPLVRLRSLEGWNHWPAEHNGPVTHTSQQLAWCEGMTTDNPERMRVCLYFLKDVKSKPTHDYAAAYQVARRVLATPTAPAELRVIAKSMADSVEALAKAHADRILMGQHALAEPATVLSRHTQLFLANFGGTPAHEQVYSDLADKLEDHHDKALKHFRKHWQAKGRDKVKQAFEAGLKAMKAGHMTHWCADRGFRDTMKTWADAAAKHKLPSKLVTAYRLAASHYEASFTGGWTSYKTLNETASL